MSTARFARPLPVLLAVLVAALAAGCGFRLAGSDPLPAVMQRPYLSFKDSYTDFADEFQRYLNDSGAHPVTAEKGASATVDVTHDEVQQRVLSVSARNIPTEYELTYTVIVAVSAGGREIMAPQTLSLTRDYSFEENRLLAKEHEEDVLRRQMARELAAIVMRRLGSLKTP